MLPQAFIKEIEALDSGSGYRSSIYGQEAHDRRLAMRQWLKPSSPDSPIGSSEPGFTQQARRTWLHHCAMFGDVLALCELIGLGATSDKADSNGVTPLHMAYTEMKILKNPAYGVMKTDGSIANKAYKEQEFKRLARVARILIEQHANVNTIIDGTSLIDLSCTWKDWDTIALLLRHGAKPSASTSSCITHRADRKRFTDLVKSCGTFQTRPPRVCPCWSGESVPDCHGKEGKPYPDRYICVCGSGKVYRQCCPKRGRYVIEKWNHSSQRILHDYDSTTGNVVPESLRNQFGAASRILETAGMDSTPDVVAAQRRIAEELLLKGEIDPAFAYGLNQSIFFPRYVFDIIGV